MKKTSILSFAVIRETVLNSSLLYQESKLILISNLPFTNGSKFSSYCTNIWLRWVLRSHRVSQLSENLGTNLGALLAALPTTLSNCTITHVLSSKASAGGLIKASAHSPPIPNSSFSLFSFKKNGGIREDFDLELAKKIRETKPDLVVLAGWMLILSAEFLEALLRDWTEAETQVESVNSLITLGESPYTQGIPEIGKPIPIINLHPALPGCFPGAHAIKDAYDNFNEPELELDLEKLTLKDDDKLKSSKKVEKITKTGIMIHRVIPLLDAGEPVLVKEIGMKVGESLDELEDRIHVVEHKAIVEAVEIVLSQLSNGSWWK